VVVVVVLLLLLSELGVVGVVVVVVLLLVVPESPFGPAGPGAPGGPGTGTTAVVDGGVFTTGGLVTTVGRSQAINPIVAKRVANSSEDFILLSPFRVETQPMHHVFPAPPAFASATTLRSGLALGA
jgi:hypothetical protein